MQAAGPWSSHQAAVYRTTDGPRRRRTGYWAG